MRQVDSAKLTRPAPKVVHFFEYRGRASCLHAEEGHGRVVFFKRSDVPFDRLFDVSDRLFLALSLAHATGQAWTFGYPVFILSTINNHLPHFASSTTYLNYADISGPFDSFYYGDRAKEDVTEAPEGLFDRFFRQLGAVPDGNNPDGPVLEPVKEPIGCDDDLAEREVGELRDESA